MAAAAAFATDAKATTPPVAVPAVSDTKSSSSAAAAPAVAPVGSELPVILGSSSIFRQQLMTEWGVPFTTASPDIDEYSVVPAGVALADRARADPQALTLAVATAKAHALLRTLAASAPDGGPDALLVCSDQVVHFAGTIREKPTSAAVVHQWLAEYRGEPGAACCTAVVVVRTARGQTGRQRWYSGTALGRQSYVTPGGVPASVVDALIGDGVILTCCGALLVSDDKVKPYLGASEGTRDELMGFPKKLTLQLLAQAQADARTDDAKLGAATATAPVVAPTPVPAPTKK